MVTSFAAVTNLPAVISLPSATSSCPSKNYHICLMRGGALSCVLSVAFSSLGVRNGHLTFSRFNRYPVDSNCFSAAATFFLSLPGPLALLVELVKPQAGCQVVYYRVIFPYLWIEHQLSSDIRHFKTEDLIQHNENAANS